METKIKCPNLCFNGNDKFYSDNNKALFTLVDCKFCNGKCIIDENKLKKIDKLI